MTTKQDVIFSLLRLSLNPEMYSNDAKLCEASQQPEHCTVLSIITSVIRLANASSPAAQYLAMFFIS